jgi:hypothetical protein
VGWVYSGTLYDSKFQAGCYATRIRDGELLTRVRLPSYVYVYRTKKGRYGVKYSW